MSAYIVSATSPTVGPFKSRRAAEDAAARLVDDPRRYASIVIEEAEEAEEVRP